MRRAGRTLWSAVLVTAFAAHAPAAAEDAPATAPAPAPLIIEPNKPIELLCATRSVVVATGAANASTGEIKLSIVLKDAAAKPPSGAWKVVSADTSHSGSLAAPAHQGKRCADSCPMTKPDDTQIQLWAPAPKGVDQLADNELLLLAVVKTASLDLRATTFSGKQIEALEQGQCKLASGTSP